MDKLPFQTSHPVVRVAGTIGVAIVGFLIVSILLAIAAWLGILSLVVVSSLLDRWNEEGYRANTLWYPVG